MLSEKFDADCARFAAVRNTMVHALAAQHAKGLQRQAAVLRQLQVDVHSLQADIDRVGHGLSDQLNAIDARSKPAWKLVPLQRVASSAENEAALTMQTAWRKSQRQARGWHYISPAERWDLVHGKTAEG